MPNHLVAKQIDGPDGRHTTALSELDQKDNIAEIGWLSLWRPVETIEVMK